MFTIEGFLVLVTDRVALLISMVADVCLISLRFRSLGGIRRKWLQHKGMNCQENNCCSSHRYTFQKNSSRELKHNFSKPMAQRGTEVICRKKGFCQKR